MSSLNFIRPEIRALKAYHVANAGDLLKLDAMENPYSMPESLQAAFGQVLSQVDINRYPDPEGEGLKEDLRLAFDIPANADIILGNGSDEIITIISQAVAQKDAVVLALEPSFVMYKANALYSQMYYVGVTLNPDFSMNVSAVLEAIKKENPTLIFIAYPNNPTGPRFKEEEVRQIIDAATGLVVIDEAYQAFASHSLMSLAGTRDNLIVMRTLSKIGLAGIRLGYAAASPNLINELNKVRPPYNINRLTLASARFCLKHKSVFDEQASILVSEREKLQAALKLIPHVVPFPSEGNFVTIKVPDAPAVFQAFLDANILIKSLHGVHPLLENCLRLSVGKPEDNLAVLAVLTQFFEST